MPLVTSLLTAIVRADGDALVLHAGERPYVVAPSGQSELASRALTLDAMTGMLGELLPADARQSLDEVGAVQHDLLSPSIFAGERFTVIAARGGNDIWIEIRRHRKPAEPPVEEPRVEEPLVEEPPPVPEAMAPPEIIEAAADPPAPLDETEVVQAAVHPEPEQVEESEPEPEPVSEPEPVAETEPDAERYPAFVAEFPTEELIDEPAEPAEMHGVLVAHDEEDGPAAETASKPEPRPAVVLPLSRHQPRSEQPVRVAAPAHGNGIDQLLRAAAARGASTLYLTSQSRPVVRVDGEIRQMDDEPVLSEPEVESLLLDIVPDHSRDTLRAETGTEWVCDVADVGRINCVTFRDHRGPGAIFRMMPARAISAEQLNLSREIQNLCGESDGLVLVAGPRSSGKSTLLSAFVDLINRSRSDHVITIESQIKFVHENHCSLVSQREVRGGHHELLAAARAAMREGPDVLVIEEMASPELVMLALEAGQSHLVISAVAANTAAGAIDRIIEQIPADRRAKVQHGLAELLRGVVAQVLLRKTGGGRVAAREVLLNTGGVANAIAEGRIAELPSAIDAGRRHGMVSLNDALVALVQSGSVESREAYRHAADQANFLAVLEQHGIDTSFRERLA